MEVDALKAGGTMLVTMFLLFFFFAPTGPDQPSRWTMIAAWLREAFIMSRPATPEPRSVSVLDRPNSAGSERANEPTNAGSEAFTRDPAVGTGGSAFTLDLALLEAIRTMIMYRESTIIKGQKPTKSDTIKALGVSRGGSERYKILSDLYDQLFGQPEPAVRFPVLTEQQLPRWVPAADD